MNFSTIGAEGTVVGGEFEELEVVEGDLGFELVEGGFGGLHRLHAFLIAKTE